MPDASTSLRLLYTASILFLFLQVSSFAQTEAFRHFAVERFRGDRELPSNELYSVVEDEKGNKWIASDAGLIKITGKKVQVLTRKDGLPQQVIYKVYYHNKRIWCTAQNGVFFYIENDRIYPLDSLSRRIQESTGFHDIIFNMLFEEDGHICLTYEGFYGYIRIDPTLQHFESKGVGKPLGMYTILTSDGQHLSFSSRQHSAIFQLYIEQDGKHYKLEHDSSVTLSGRKIISTPDSSGILYFTSFNTLLAYKGEKKVAQIRFPDNILSLSRMGDLLLVGVHSEGLFLVDKTFRVSQIRKPALSISSIMVGSEGCLWITTLEDGLYVCKNTEADIRYAGQIPVSNIVKLSGNKIHYILAYKKLCSEDGKEKDVHIKQMRSAPSELERPKILNAFSMKLNGREQDVLLTGFGLYSFDGKDARPLFPYTANLPFYKSFVKTEEGAYYGAITSVFFYPDNLSWSDTLRLNDGITAMEPYGNLLLVSLRLKGIVAVWLKNRKLHSLTLGPGVRINHVLPLGKDSFAIATNEWGFYIADIRTQQLQRIENTPLSVSKVKQRGSYLYLGTKEGLFVYNLVSRRLSGYNSQNSYPFNEIVDFDITGDTIWLAGRRYVLRQPLGSLQKKHRYPSIYISAAEAGKKHIGNLTELQHLQSDQGNIRLLIDNPSYLYYSSSDYHYTVYNEQGKALYSDVSDVPEIRADLRPGKYHIRIFAADRYHNVRSADVIVKLFIHPAFYQTWWFRLIMLFLTAAFIFLAIRIATRIIRARESKQRLLLQKVNELEALALQSQMNPHFTFNAINSIQDYILSNKNEEAHHYLAEFAKLIRMVLMHNRKKMITVSEEIKLLQTYIGLEEQRLKDHIVFDVDFAENTDPDSISIPSMLMQPIVENAIWHGLRFKEGEKRIHIGLKVSGALLYIIITDNGTGLTESASKHVSQGLLIIKERIKLLYDKEPEFEYFTINNNPEQPGVIVRIVLPLIDEFD